LKISGSHTLPMPPEQAYQTLQDPAVLARCMPGCDELVRTGENQYSIKMRMALAALAGQFTGTVRISDAEPFSRFRLVVEATGRIGFVKGDGLLSFEPSETATKVSYEGDVQAGGTIASVGQRLMDSTARMMIKRFFDCMTQSTAPGPS
jgi:uncharacterized protein